MYTSSYPPFFYLEVFLYFADKGAKFPWKYWWHPYGLLWRWRFQGTRTLWTRFPFPCPTLLLWWLSSHQSSWSKDKETQNRYTIYMYIHTHTPTYIHTFVYVYIYTCIHTYSYTSSVKFPSLLKFLLNQKRAIKYDLVELRTSGSYSANATVNYTSATANGISNKDSLLTTTRCTASVCSMKTLNIGPVIVSFTSPSQEKWGWKCWKKRAPAGLVSKVAIVCPIVEERKSAMKMAAPKSIMKLSTKRNRELAFLQQACVATWPVIRTFSSYRKSKLRKDGQMSCGITQHHYAP